ncbi:MAG: hypothetical protein JST04_14530 [Bdellovibrionales bacterium]|nr:hypothetical protein [Bdellovibrionales bacterium]
MKNTKRSTIILVGVIVSIIPLAVPLFRLSERIKKVNEQKALLDSGPTVKVMGEVGGGHTGGNERSMHQIRFPVNGREFEVDFYHPASLYLFGKVEVEYLEKDPTVFRLKSGPTAPAKVSGEDE